VAIKEQNGIIELCFITDRHYQFAIAEFSFDFHIIVGSEEGDVTGKSEFLWSFPAHTT
jgi:hypothetical protein